MNSKKFEGSIEALGRGEVLAAPDQATVKLDVVTRAKTAAEAVAANAKRTQAVIDAVEDEPNSGVTTTGLGVDPIVKYDDETNTSTIIGFQATNGVRVVTRPAMAGQVFDAGIRAGANVSSGITYSIKDEAPLREQALRLAVEHAHSEAEIVAKTAGVTLIGPETIVIDPVGPSILLRSERYDASALATPVIPEDLAVDARVRIVFKTKVG